MKYLSYPIPQWDFPRISSLGVSLFQVINLLNNVFSFHITRDTWLSSAYLSLSLTHKGGVLYSVQLLGVVNDQ